MEQLRGVALHGLDVGRDAREVLERRNRLEKVHAAAVERTGTDRAGVAKKLGLRRSVHDVGDPEIGPQIGDWNRRARWIFWEGVDPERGDERLRERARGYRERIQGHLESFANELAIVDAARLATGRPTCREAFEMLVDGLRYRRDYPAELRPARRDLIGDVRRCMALLAAGRHSVST